MDNLSALTGVRRTIARTKTNFFCQLIKEQKRRLESCAVKKANRKKPLRGFRDKIVPKHHLRPDRLESV